MVHFESFGPLLTTCRRLASFCSFRLDHAPRPWIKGHGLTYINSSSAAMDMNVPLRWVLASESWTLSPLTVTHHLSSSCFILQFSNCGFRFHHASLPRHKWHGLLHWQVVVVPCTATTLYGEFLPQECDLCVTWSSLTAHLLTSKQHKRIFD